MIVLRGPVLRFVVAAAALGVAAAALVPALVAPSRAEGGLDKVGEFRPFPRHNKTGTTNVLSELDHARRTWFFVTSTDPDTGAVGPPNVWTFDLDSREQRGAKLTLAGSVPAHFVSAVDPDTGVFLFMYDGAGGTRLAAIHATPAGPQLAAEWVITGWLRAERSTFSLNAAGMRVTGGKGYLVVDAPFVAPKETAMFQFDVAKLLAGQDPLDWRYGLTHCASLAHFNGQTAIGKSTREPIVAVPCRAHGGGNDLQGMAVVELSSFAPSNAAGLVERFYPIAGDYGVAESFFDPTSDRIAMRRVLPAQLVVFDMASRRWMRPVVFGQNNMYQTAIDETTGRIYGHGNDPGAGSDKEYIYVPEVRPTPPQNGLSVPLQGPSPQFPVVGNLAVDSTNGLVYVADVDRRNDPQFGHARDGLFFHVYRDTRPRWTAGRAFDPDQAVTNLSGESQGYGARVSYVGGAGGTYRNTFGGQEYPFGGVVAQGTRHVTFARTLRARLTEGESSAEATVSHPEGAADSEVKNTNEGGWPHESTSCRDFGSSPTSERDPSGGAEVTCDLDYPRTLSTAVYEADTQDPSAAPFQRAATDTVISIHATKGVATTVTSEGSLDLPGVVTIGRIRATATTYAAGKKGKASSEYTREMRDVSIAGQPYCSADCDPDEVAAAINERFAPMAATGTLVVASVPRPDATLLASPGGVQAIVQRDLWDHEEDVGIHDGADDRYELPAFVVTVYQDRRFPQHEIYSLAGVQAVSRLPLSLADKLDELAGPDNRLPLTRITPDAGAGPTSLDGFRRPVGPAGSSLSAPVDTVPITNRRGSVRFAERLAWTLASPFRSMPMLTILAFLAVPVYLAARRRLLLAYRPAQAGDVDAV